MPKQKKTTRKTNNEKKNKSTSFTKKSKDTPQKSKQKASNKKETTSNMKSKTTMPKSGTKKDKKEKQTITSSKKTNTTSKSKVSKKEETKEKRTITKETPKNKRKRHELDEIEVLEKDALLDEDGEVEEIEELDIQNIEPVISDTDDVLLDEEDDEIEPTPKTRGRKKQIQPTEVPHQQTMEEIIRSRPLQIDPTTKVYVSKKEDEPKPYIASSKSTKDRYSDKELQEFKQIILQKLKETKENYDQLKKFFTHEDDNGIDDTSPTFKMIEDGSGVMTKEEIEQQLARLEKYMIDLQNALLRIENKTYGICTVTGKLIPKERLRSVPHATKSIEVKINRNT